MSKGVTCCAQIIVSPVAPCFISELGALSWVPVFCIGADWQLANQKTRRCETVLLLAREYFVFVVKIFYCICLCRENILWHLSLSGNCCPGFCLCRENAVPGFLSWLTYDWPIRRQKGYDWPTRSQEGWDCPLIGQRIFWIMFLFPEILPYRKCCSVLKTDRPTWRPKALCPVIGQLKQILASHWSADCSSLWLSSPK